MGEASEADPNLPSVENYDIQRTHSTIGCSQSVGRIDQNSCSRTHLDMLEHIQLESSLEPTMSLPQVLLNPIQRLQREGKRVVVSTSQVEAPSHTQSYDLYKKKLIKFSR